MDLNELIRDVEAHNWTDTADFLREVQAAMWEAIADIDCYSVDHDLCSSCWSKVSTLGHESNCGAQETAVTLRRLAGERPNGET